MDENRTPEEQFSGDQSYRPPIQPQSPAADPRLAGVTAPVLDDFGASEPAPQPQTRFQYLTPEQIAILQQQRAEKGLPPFTEEEIAEKQAEFIERQRVQFQQQMMAQQMQAQQQAAAAASALLAEEDPNAYQQKETHSAAEALPQVEASALLEEAAPEPERKVTFNQEDLEAAKRKAVKSASASLDSGPKTEEEAKRARKELEALRQQQMADLAQQGFITSIIAAVIGVIASVCMILFSTVKFPENFEPNAFFTLADKFYLIAGVALVALSVVMIFRVTAVKGLTSFLFGASSVLLVIPGIVCLLEKETSAFSIGVFVVAVIGCFAVTFIMSTSEKLSAYYARKDYIID